MIQKYRFLLFLFMICLSIESHAQTDADSEYKKGIELQKKKTVSSQNEAIARFEAARTLYVSKENKKKCDNQIAKCRKIIKELQPKPKPKPKPTIDINNDDKKVENNDKSSSEKEVSSKQEDVQLSLSEELLEFKGKPKGQQSVRVICNYDDWSIESTPEWVGVYPSLTKDRISVEAEKNTTGQNRSGNIVIKCKNKTVNLIVHQKKLGIFGKIADDFNNSIKK